MFFLRIRHHLHSLSGLRNFLKVRLFAKPRIAPICTQGYSTSKMLKQNPLQRDGKYKSARKSGVGIPSRMCVELQVETQKSSYVCSQGEHGVGPRTPSVLLVLDLDGCRIGGASCPSRQRSLSWILRKSGKCEQTHHYILPVTIGLLGRLFSQPLSSFQFPIHFPSPGFLGGVTAWGSTGALSVLGSAGTVGDTGLVGSMGQVGPNAGGFMGPVGPVNWVCSGPAAISTFSLSGCFGSGGKHNPARLGTKIQCEDI